MVDTTSVAPTVIDSDSDTTSVASTVVIQHQHSPRDHLPTLAEQVDFARDWLHPNLTQYQHLPPRVKEALLKTVVPSLPLGLLGSLELDAGLQLVVGIPPDTWLPSHSIQELCRCIQQKQIQSDIPPGQWLHSVNRLFDAIDQANIQG